MSSIDLMYQELKELLDSKVEAASYRLVCELMINDEPYPITKLMRIDRIHKYDTEIMEGLNVVATLPLGTYNHDIYPNRKNLQVRMYHVPIDTKGNDIKEDKAIKTTLFDCVLTTPTSNVLIDGSELTTSKDKADKVATTTIAFQLVDSVENEYRTREVSGIFKNTTVLKVMQLLLRTEFFGPGEPSTSVISSADYAEGAFSKIVGLDIVPPDNDRVYKHIIIPSGTKVVDLPDYLQVNYGVYNHGLGNYARNGIVYVYPLTNTKRANVTPRMLTIGNFPEHVAPLATTTWKLKDSGEVYIAATRKVGHVDVSESIEKNQGIVKYVLNSEAVMSNIAVAKDGIASAYVGDNLLFTAGYDTNNSTTFATLSKGRITGNIHMENSRINSGKIGLLTLDWENANPELLYPGMPVRFLFPAGDKIGVLLGTLTMVDSTIAPIRSGLQETSYITNTTLGVAVEAIGNK